MELKTLESNQAPDAVGPYSQAKLAGNFIYTSGQLGIDPGTGELQEGFEAEVNQVLENLLTLVKSGGGESNSIVKITVYLIETRLYESFNNVYESFFTTNPPARSVVGASELPGNARVEIEAVALKKTTVDENDQIS